MPLLTAFCPDSTCRPLSVVVCGNRNRSGFREVAQWFRALQAWHEFSLAEYDSPGMYFDDEPNESRPVDMFVVFQEYPGQFDRSTFDRLRARSPLARTALLLDSLCRGELRTGYPASNCCRFYLDQWNGTGRQWFEAFLSGEMQGDHCYWSLPLTCTDSDLANALIGKSKNVSPFLAPLVEYNSGTNTQCAIDVFVIAESDTELGRFVVELCSTYSRTAHNGTFKELFELSSEPNEIVVDSVDLADPTFRLQVEQMGRQFPRTAIRILAFAPHAEEIAAYESLSHCRVLGKPF